MIWNNAENPQLGLTSSYLGEHYIFRDTSEFKIHAGKRVAKAAWLITDNAFGDKPVSGGMVVHQQFPLFLAYWSVPEASDSRFLKHETMPLCITLPIPLNAVSEESLNIQENRDIWLDEALAAVLAKLKKIATLNFAGSALDLQEDIEDCTDREISYPKAMDYSNSPFSINSEQSRRF